MRKKGHGGDGAGHPLATNFGGERGAEPGPLPALERGADRVLILSSGGEELGGLRALRFYHQRCAIQASTAVLGAGVVPPTATASA